MFETAEAVPVAAAQPADLPAIADCGGLSSEKLVDLVAEVERRVAGLHALQANAIAELAGRPVFEGGRLQRPASDHLEAAELVAAEVGAACCWSRSAASARVHLALDLVTRLPATMGALAAGSIDLARARVISEAVLPLAQPAATAVEQRVLPRAGEQTTAQLGAALRRAVLHADPAAAAARHEQAVAARRVTLRPLPDGIAELAAPLRADHAEAIYTRLTDIARQALRARRGDTRPPGTVAAAPVPVDDWSLDRLRADALVWLTLGEPMPGVAHRPDSATGNNPAAGSGSATGAGSGTSGGHGVNAQRGRSCAHCGGPRPRPLIHVVVPVGTVLGISDEPGELAGYGPIPATLTRDLAADTAWRRILTDPANGTTLASETRSYQPPPGIAAFVRARDGTCRAPGCRQPATRADLDHVRPWPRGQTSPTNLAALCRFHHLLKTHHGWRLELDAHTGRAYWTSPLGRVYTTTAGGTPPVGTTAVGPSSARGGDRQRVGSSAQS